MFSRYKLLISQFYSRDSGIRRSYPHSSIWTVSGDSVPVTRSLGRRGRAAPKVTIICKLRNINFSTLHLDDCKWAPPAVYMSQCMSISSSYGYAIYTCWLASCVVSNIETCTLSSTDVLTYKQTIIVYPQSK